MPSVAASELKRVLWCKLCSRCGRCLIDNVDGFMGTTHNELGPGVSCLTASYNICHTLD